MGERPFRTNFGAAAGPDPPPLPPPPDPEPGPGPVGSGASARQVAAVIRAERLRRQIPVGEVARLAGTNKTTLYSIERLRGSRDTRFDTLVRYAAAVGLDLECTLTRRPGEPAAVTTDVADSRHKQGTTP